MKTSAVRPEATRGRLVLRLRAGIAVLAGRLTYRMLRVAGRSATTLPGRIALALDPDLLRRLASRYRVVLVTGTNGKTTASRMITGILRRAGRHVADNPAGANLSSGLTTALLKTGTNTRHADSFPIAVLEVDEAAFAAASASLAPEICIVTNIFRDQLDRYGERDAMRGLIAKGLADAFAARGDRGATFVFCADDPLCESLADPYRNHSEVQVVFTGMDEKEMHPAGIRDGIPGETAHCPDCHMRYSYRSIAYGHLGDYHCPACGRSRPKPHIRFRMPEGVAGRSAVFVRTATAGGPEEAIAADIAIPGVHNLYNAVSALSAAAACDVPFPRACALLSAVTPAFGRMEKLTLAGHTVWMILVKNPAGMDRALEHVCAAPDAGAVYFLLNSGDADGRDTSWIWDARFEDRQWPGPVFVSGRRTWDMALRLRYSGLPSASVHAGEDAGVQLDKALAALPPERALYLLPNYTAMLDLRAGSLRKYGVNVFGEGRDEA